MHMANVMVQAKILDVRDLRSFTSCVMAGR